MRLAERIGWRVLAATAQAHEMPRARHAANRRLYEERTITTHVEARAPMVSTQRAGAYSDTVTVRIDW